MSVVRLHAPSSPVYRPETIAETCAMVREALRHSGRNYKEIASTTGLNYNTINRIAGGDTQEPRASTVGRIMLALGYRSTWTKD